jgi:hypothetical protein
VLPHNDVFHGSHTDVTSTSGTELKGNRIRSLDSLPARLAGILRHPRRTFEAITAGPGWTRDCSIVLLLTTFTVAAAGAAVFGTDIGRLALLDEWERSAAAFGRPVDDAEYIRLRTLSENGVVYGIGRALVTGPMALGAVALLVYALFRRRRPDMRLGQVFAVVVYSGVVLAIRQLIAVPAVWVRETTASATAIGRWFPVFDEASPAARLLSMLDLFVLWWLVLLAIGVSVLYGVRARRTAIALVALYLVVAAVMAGAMAVLGGTA